MTVELDTRELELGVRRLARAVESNGPDLTLEAAARAAERIRQRVPKRTGRAAGSVRAAHHGSGLVAASIVTAGAPYFGWLNWGGTRGRPYVAAGRYTGPATAGAGPAFQHACHEMTRREIRKL